MSEPPRNQAQRNEPLRWDDDDQLLSDLGEALRGAGEVPPRFVQAGKAAFAWLSVDADLASLSYDSAALDAAPVGIRGADSGSRALTFSASSVSIELEVTPDALLGQVVPPQEGTVQVTRSDGASSSAPVDDVGFFAVRPRPVGLFRLQLQLRSGATIHTEWITVSR